MPFFELKSLLAEEVATFFAHPDITAQQIYNDFSYPPNIQLGHVALPCFRLSKILKKPTDQIVRELGNHFNQSHKWQSTAAGPYANFKWNIKLLLHDTLSSIAHQKERYGHDESGTGKRVVLEYCSPNVAKKLAFQHIRSTLIGNVLGNIYDALGYKTERINFVGDWGSQFARLLAAFEHWGEKGRVNSIDITPSMNYLFELYVKFHKEVDSHPEYLTWASECLQRLEEGETRALETWKLIRDISIKAMDRTLRRMNVAFHHVEGESHYVKDVEKTLSDIKSKAEAKKSDGAWIVEVEGFSTPALVQKKDGTTLYLTRDIAAAIDRFQRFNFDRMLYVVSEQQKLHFQLLFGVLKKMGYDWADRCQHISFGTVLFGAEKMSTREGRVVFLDDILDEAKNLALEECTKKNPDLKDKEAVAERVGIGAIIFGELSCHRQRDMEFDWKNVLALDGDTGPYVQYSVVRCYSLLEKAANELHLPNFQDFKSYETAIEEEALVLALSKFRLVLHQVIRDQDPLYLTQYLLEVSKAFSRFYYKLPVLQATDPLQKSVRLELVRGTRQTLENGLNLLGIDVPKEM